ncbi:MAG: amino acid permease-associated region [Francisellaceae bacterium]|nr:amino acid permease-associated region [Francisellaceae bacterium]
MIHKNKTLTTFTLAMLTVAAIISLRNLPISAVYGFSSVFFILIAAIFFLIPIALVTAELTAAWPMAGGNYIWVGKAFGKKWGFLALWLAWMESVAWFPAILAFIANLIAYTLIPFFPGLTNNTAFHFILILVIFWGTTILNFFGIRTSSLMSTIGVLLGTIIPGVLIISLGAYWFFSGQPLAIDISFNHLIPSFKWDNLVLFSGILLGFAGVELAAFHIHDAKNPQKDYPKALLIAVSIIIILSILGTLSIAVVVPTTNIHLVSGLMQAFTAFFTHFHMVKAIPLISLLLVIGSLAGVNTWVIGPAKGLLVAAEDDFLPPLLQKTNKNGAPIGLLILQAIIGSVLSLIFLWIKDTNISFWILTALSAQFTVLQYLLVFLSALKLRYSHPLAIRPYKVPGNNLGLWIVTIIGCIICLFGFFIAFVKPSQLAQDQQKFYAFYLGISLLVLISLPKLFIHKNAKKI